MIFIHYSKVVIDVLVKLALNRYVAVRVKNKCYFVVYLDCVSVLAMQYIIPLNYFAYF